jgi:hypothetical protein
MKIYRNQLKNLIGKLLKEEEEKVQGKIILGMRTISGPDYEPGAPASSRALSVYLDNIAELFNAYDVESPVRPGHSSHAFVYVENAAGERSTYSGKSGIVFKATEMLKRLAIGRNLSTDEKLLAIKAAYESGKTTKDEVIKALETTSWGPLRKIKNWDRDSLDDASELYEIMPMKFESQQELDKAALRIETAFNNYKEDTPYDPLPGTDETLIAAARNSNSFAYTLVLEALGSEEELNKRVRGFDSTKLPGWGLIVPGLNSGDKS